MARKINKNQSNLGSIGVKGVFHPVPIWYNSLVFTEFLFYIMVGGV